jgi:PEP-CTERM motif
MNRAPMFALLGFLMTLGTNATIEAASIVYNIQNYADLQNGYTLSGTITTDGTIGTLTSANITAWSFSVTGPAAYELTSQTPETYDQLQGLTASATSITLAPPSSEFAASYLTFTSPTTGTALIYDRYSPFTGSLEEYYFTTPGESTAWNDSANGPPGLKLGGSTWTIATASVPEPSTLTLALLGIACLAVQRVRYRTHRA